MDTTQTVSNLGGAINWDVAQGTDFGPVTLTFTQPDGVTPVDLTGCSLLSEIRKNPSGPVLFTATTVITNPTGGVATYTIPAALTAALTPGASITDPQSQYVWDLKLTDSAGKVSRPCYGNLNLLREITP